MLFVYNPCTQSAISFFFDKLKYEIRNKVLIFGSIQKLRQKITK